MQSVLHAAAMIPASIPSPDWSGFDIPLPWGSLRIHAYALCILAGIIAGLWLTSVRWARRGAPEGSVWDIAIWAIPFGIIGGRLYHVVSSPDAYFGPGFDGTGDLSLIPQIQRGGLGIWGAVLLGRRGRLDRLPPGRRQAHRLPRRRGARAAAGPGDRPLGQLLQPGTLRRPHHAALGTADRRRQPELPARHAGGHALPPDVPLRIPLEPGRRRPSCWCWTGSFNFRRGRLFWLYAIYYTLGRVWIEAMRIDDAEQINLFGITTRLNVWTSIFVLLVALAAFIVLGLRKPDGAGHPLPARAANRPRRADADADADADAKLPPRS